MANSTAKFDNESPPMSEAEAGPIDMSSAPEPIREPEINPQLDLDEPPPNQTEINFDETGAMVEKQVVQQHEEPEAPTQEVSAAKEPQPEPKIEIPDWFKPYAQSQEAMAEYFEWQRQEQLAQQQRTQKYQEQQSQAYYSSPEYITQVCEQNGLDAEDPVHRQLIQTRLDTAQQSQAYNARIQHLENAIANQTAEQAAKAKESEMDVQFQEAASVYSNAPSEIIAAAKRQAMMLASKGVDPREAINESIQFVRLAAEQSSAKPSASVEQKRQARIDQLNSAGPGRGAKSHRKPDGISMAEADMLVSRGGFFPN